MVMLKKTEILSSKIIFVCFNLGVLSFGCFFLLGLFKSSQMKMFYIFVRFVIQIMVVGVDLVLIQSDSNLCTIKVL